MKRTSIALFLILTIVCNSFAYVDFTWPTTEGSILTSAYGPGTYGGCRFHFGIDIQTGTTPQPCYVVTNSDAGGLSKSNTVNLNNNPLSIRAIDVNIPYLRGKDIIIHY